MTEKRIYERYPIWFPVTLAVDADGREVWAICRDASPGGVLVSAAAPLDVGTKLVARFRVSPDIRTERAVHAKVVRQELTSDELMLAFPYRAALEFTETVPDLLSELAAHADRTT